MEVIIEELLIYGVVFFVCGLTVYLYLKSLKKKSKQIEEKVQIAKMDGLFEPVSLHPYIDLNKCFGSAACVADCPEKDILGIVDGKATVIQTTNCIGHGACFHACPVEAISLKIGTETRGVDLPHINQNFETNMSGIFIAGELGGMGLIKNCIEQGHQAIKSIIKLKKPKTKGIYDVAIIGAGPAGISATLAAKEAGLTSITLEQNSIGGTVYNFPRAKIVMTQPMHLPLYGKVKLFNTSKDELIELWHKVINEHNLTITENTKVEGVIPQKDGTFKVNTNRMGSIIANTVLIAIGRRGSPRKLGIPGEELEKVAYRLIESERISKKNIVIIGGGDSAIESVLLLMDNNNVTLSYRKDKFARLKPKNRTKITKAIEDGKVNFIPNSNLVSIHKEVVLILKTNEALEMTIKNDLVYIFAGGELPTKFLQKAGIEIQKKFGYIVKKHN